MATIKKYQTKSGATSYMVRYRTPDHSQTCKRGFPTRRAAAAFAATVETAKLRGEYVAPSTGRTTVGELGPAWLQRQRGHLKAASMAAYRTGWQVNVEPRWGATPIGSIRHSDVSGWVADLASRRGAQTVRTAAGVLRGILADAVADRMLAVNPAAGVKLPKRPPARHVYLTAAQLSALADECGQYGSLVLLLGAVGPRFGEAAALRVADIDWLHRRVTLTRNAVTVNGRVVVGTLKANANRTVPLPAFVLDALAETARGKGRDDLLWASSGGRYLMPPHGRMWLASAVARCQAGDPTFPRVTAHDLRHTAASLAIHAGAHPKVVQRMLGHTSAAMTLDVYADLFDSDLDAVAENVAKMWSRRVNSH